MIIENIGKIVVLYSEGDKKITDNKMSFFSDVVYLGKNDSPNNYKEVGYDVWRNYIPNFIPSNKAEEIKEEIEALKEEATRLKNENILLTELLLENDFRISQEINSLKQSK